MMKKYTILIAVLAVVTFGVGFLGSEWIKSSILPMPDLKITDVKVTTEDPQVGQQVMFAVYVKNVGREPSGIFSVIVKDRDSDIKGVGIGKALEKDAKVLVNVAVKTEGITPGKHVFDVEVDYKNEVVESSEKKNVKSVKVDFN